MFRYRYRTLALSLPILAASLNTVHGFYGDPPDSKHPWGVHDMNRPQPAIVTPGIVSTQDQVGTAPSDAVVLFGGKADDMKNWISDKNGEPTKWQFNNGVLQCVPGAGYIRTVEEFGDCQLHVEWWLPADVKGQGQGRGNSGVFLMGQVEIQVLDNYNNPSYADGMAGSLYGVNPPAANALREPGQWQSYDIIFRKPVYEGDRLIDPGYVTVFVNGVLVQDHTPLEGPTGHRGRTSPKPFPAVGPLKLQDHGNDVRFRNIWYRPLAKRSIEGGTDGVLSEKATAEKRAEIAKEILAKAEQAEGRQKWELLAESLIYYVDPVIVDQLKDQAEAKETRLQNASDADLDAHKDEIINASRKLSYLVKHERLPKDFPLYQRLEAILKAKDWK